MFSCEFTDYLISPSSRVISGVREFNTGWHCRHIMIFLYMANINVCCLSISIEWIYKRDRGKFALDSMILIVTFKDFATA